MSYPMDRPLPSHAGQWNGIEPDVEEGHIEGCVLDPDHAEPCLRLGECWHCGAAIVDASGLCCTPVEERP